MNSRIYLYKVIILILVSSTIITLGNSSVFSEELEIYSFLGPKVGTKYIYNLNEGGTLEVLGLASKNNNFLEIQEKLQIPNLVLPTGEKSLTNKYDLLIRDGKLIKKSSKGEDILLQKPIVPNSSVWKMFGVIAYANGSKKATSKCKITEVSKQHIFGVNRAIVTVRCEMKTDSLGTYIDITRYAEGIGMIENSKESVTEKGERHSVLLKITLKNIVDSPKESEK